MTVAIETSRGDFEEIARFLEEVWAPDYEGDSRLDFSPGFLEWQLTAPGADHELQLEARRGGRLVGFTAGLPRTVRVRDTPWPAMLGTFFTVHPAYRRRRLGWQLFAERQRRSRARGDALGLVFVEEGRAADRLFARYDRETDQPIRPILRTPLWLHAVERGRPAHAPRADPNGLRPLQEADVTRCRERLNGPREGLALARYWTNDEELTHEIHRGPGSGGIVLETESGVVGLVTWHVRRLVGRQSERVGILENAVLGAVTREAGGGIVRAAVARCARSGCRAVLVNGPTGLDAELLRSCGFVEFPSPTRLFAVPAPAGPDLGPVTGACLAPR